jgi:hypothetical protein
MGANKDTHDRYCVDVSARVGHFFHVPKDWEVKLGVVGDAFFQSFQSDEKVHMLILTFNTVIYSIVILCLVKVIFLQNVCVLFVCATLFYVL